MARKSEPGPSPGGITLQLQPAYVRMPPVGAYLHARAFQAAADTSKDHPDRMSTVTGFLYCRAIELGLKAYLFARGVRIPRSIRHTHDLGLLLIETHARGLDLVISLTRAEMDVIRTAGAHYLENKLSYFDLFFAVRGPKLPLEELGAVTTRLLDALKAPCFEASDAPTWSPIPARGRTKRQ